MIDCECPRCGGVQVIKSGRTKAGKQRYQCRICGRYFVIDPDGVAPIVAELAERMILQGVDTPKIVKVLQGHASRSWVYGFRRDIHVSR